MWFERIVSTLLVIFGIKVILKVRKYACVSLGLINITLVLFSGYLFFWFKIDKCR